MTSLETEIKRLKRELLAERECSTYFEDLASKAYEILEKEGSDTNSVTSDIVTEQGVSSHTVYTGTDNHKFNYRFKNQDLDILTQV